MTGDDEDDEAEQALKGSPGGAFTFGPPDVDAYNIRFAQGVQVDTFRFEIRLSSSVSRNLFCISNSRSIAQKQIYSEYSH